MVYSELDHLNFSKIKTNFVTHLIQNEIRDQNILVFFLFKYFTHQALGSLDTTQRNYIL